MPAMLLDCKGDITVCQLNFQLASMLQTTTVLAVYLKHWMTIELLHGTS